jgi:hypothetical protein
MKIEIFFAHIAHKSSKFLGTKFPQKKIGGRKVGNFSSVVPQPRVSFHNDNNKK